jgi:AcrB/AcrD/AcrF family
VPISSAASKRPQYPGGLGSINEGPSPGVESHYNVEPLFDIYAAAQDRDLGGMANDVNRILSDTAKDVPRGSRVLLGGQVRIMRTAYDQLYLGLAGAIFLIYLVIVVNFQSWVDPFIIVAALPGVLAGIIWMLFLTGTYLSVPALTGAIMCMGIAASAVDIEPIRIGKFPVVAVHSINKGHARFSSCCCPISVHKIEATFPPFDALVYSPLARYKPTSTPGGPRHRGRGVADVAPFLSTPQADRASEPARANRRAASGGDIGVYLWCSATRNGRLRRVGSTANHSTIWKTSGPTSL